MAFFLIDENPDVRIGSVLSASGHEVEFVKEVLGERTTDDQIVGYANARYAIVVTGNHRHFRTLAYEALEDGRKKSRTWGLLDLACNAERQVHRLRFLLPLVEQEILAAERRHPNSLLLHMDIANRSYTVHV